MRKPGAAAMGLMALFMARGAAQGARAYGEAGIVLARSLWNESRIDAQSTLGASGMAANLWTDIVLSAKDESLGLMYLNALVVGSMNGPPSGAAAPALELSISQCYFQVPLGSMLLLSAGLKNKSIGYASRYNVSNRLTPNARRSAGTGISALGIAELDVFVAPWLAAELLGYLPRADSWEDLSAACGLKLDLNPIAIDVYGYLEEFEFPYLGYNASIQADRFKFYGEGMLSDRPQQADARGDTEGVSIQQAFGVEAALPGIQASLEYLYRSDGPDKAERAALETRLRSLPDPVERRTAIGTLYSAGAFDSHYLALGLRSDLIPGLLKTEMDIALSAGRDPDEWTETLGAMAEYRLTLRPVQNFSMTMFLSFALGGEGSEYAMFQAARMAGGFTCAYSFNAM
jgi:hypothetical protein